MTSKLRQHMTSKQLRISVDASSKQRRINVDTSTLIRRCFDVIYRCIDVHTTLFRRHEPAIIYIRALHCKTNKTKQCNFTPNLMAAELPLILVKPFRCFKRLVMSDCTDPENSCMYTTIADRKIRPSKFSPKGVTTQLLPLLVLTYT